MTPEPIRGLQLFRERFADFVRDAGYAVREQATEPRKYYRFQQPTDETFPEMLELFSRKPDGLDVPPDAHLTPIPIDSDVSRGLEEHRWGD